MEELAGYRVEILTALENVLNHLAGFCEVFPDEVWRAPSSRGTPTAYDFLAHLHALEANVFAIHLPRIVMEEMPVVPIFDDLPRLVEQRASSQPVGNILDEFAHLRRQEVAWLGGLSTENWSCVARHPWWGIRTFQWWVELQLEYSHQHLAEISVLLHR